MTTTAHHPDTTATLTAFDAKLDSLTEGDYAGLERHIKRLQEALEAHRASLPQSHGTDDTQASLAGVEHDLDGLDGLIATIRDTSIDAERPWSIERFGEPAPVRGDFDGDGEFQEEVTAHQERASDHWEDHIANAHGFVEATLAGTA